MDTRDEIEGYRHATGLWSGLVAMVGVSPPNPGEEQRHFKVFLVVLTLFLLFVAAVAGVIYAVLFL
jgi:hypothetical protein